MNRTELIDALAAEASVEKNDAKRFLDALTTVVEKAMRAGGEVPFKGLGKFRVQHRKARTGRNPITGDPVEIAAKTVVKFTVAKSLKDLIK